MMDEDEVEADGEGEGEVADAEPVEDEEPTDPGVDLRAAVEDLAKQRRRQRGEVTVKRAGGDVRLILDRASTLIGRDNDCDIVVDEPSVSRKHARLVQNQRGYFELIDLGSASGTVNQGYGVERMILDDGDAFSVGTTEFILHLVEEEEAALG